MSNELDNYLPEDFIEEDGYISTEFDWQYVVVEEETAIMLYTTNSSGEETKIIMNFDSMEEFMNGARDYFNILKENQ